MKKERLLELAGINNSNEKLTEAEPKEELIRVSIVINTTNAAFDEPTSEVARILNELANDIAGGSRAKRPGMVGQGGKHSLRDINGNKVGEVTFTYGKV